MKRTTVIDLLVETRERAEEKEGKKERERVCVFSLRLGRDPKSLEM